MQIPPTFDDIRPLIADVLALDLEDITPSSTFFGDLGGESIDWIDFTFVIKKNCDLHLDQLNKSIHQDSAGRLTPESVRFLRSFLPDFDPTSITNSNLKQRLDELLDIQSIVRLIHVLHSQRQSVQTG